MRIAISGVSGFIGSYLSQYFIKKGHAILPLFREIFLDKNESELKGLLSQSDIVINLAGAPINHRWTKSYKKELYDSRISPTCKIVNAINDLAEKPKLFISASAVGYYPSEGCYDEYNSKKGTGFLSDLCQAWEDEAEKISPEVRLAITRFGVVLADKGGAFEQMALPAKLGIAPVIGNGNQLFPWIDIVDLACAMEHIINNSEIEGVVNLVASEQITNKELMKAVAKHYKSCFTIKIPTIAFRVLMGEGADFITKGQCVKPQKLLASGFVFKTPLISKFCTNLMK